MEVRPGSDINQLVFEYRALRAGVVKLRCAAVPDRQPADIKDLMRFNDTVDPTLAASPQQFIRAIEQSRALSSGQDPHAQPQLNIVAQRGEVPPTGHWRRGPPLRRPHTDA